MSQPMDQQTMQMEVMQTKRAVESIHQWLSAIAVAVDDHASALDANRVDMTTMKGKPAAFDRQYTEALATCEKNLTDTFGKVDALAATCCATGSQPRWLERDHPSGIGESTDWRWRE